MSIVSAFAGRGAFYIFPIFLRTFTSQMAQAQTLNVYNKQALFNCHGVGKSKT